MTKSLCIYNMYIYTKQTAQYWATQYSTIISDIMSILQLYVYYASTNTIIAIHATTILYIPSIYLTFVSYLLETSDQFKLTAIHSSVYLSKATQQHQLLGETSLRAMHITWSTGCRKGRAKWLGHKNDVSSFGVSFGESFGITSSPVQWKWRAWRFVSPSWRATMLKWYSTIVKSLYMMLCGLFVRGYQKQRWEEV